MSVSLLNKLKTLLSHQHKMLLTGLSGSGKAYFVSALTALSRQTICLLPTEEKAHDLWKDLQPWCASTEISRFLSRDFIFNKENFSSHEAERLQTLKNLAQAPERQRIIIATPAALLYPIVAPNQLRENNVCLQPGMSMERDHLLKALTLRHYRHSGGTVTQPGQMAVRGGIVDVYPLDLKQPVRIEFFGDTIDSVREFNPHSQRSTGTLQQLILSLADEVDYQAQGATLFDYLPPHSAVFIDDPALFGEQFERQYAYHKHYVEEARKNNPLLPQLRLASYQQLADSMSGFPQFYHRLFAGSGAKKDFSHYEHISMQEVERFFGHYDLFITRAKNWQQQGYHLEIFYTSPGFRHNLDLLLQQAGIGPIIWKNAPLTQGFVSKTFAIAVISEADITGKLAAAPIDAATASTRILENLHPGDYVVHETYGIAIFHGVKQVTTDDITREYVLLQYAGTDRLYLPIDRLNLLHKYASAEAKAPRLNRLGSHEWQRTRARVKQSIRDMTEELVTLYARRHQAKGFAFLPDSPWQKEFESEFPYQETPGQLEAIRAIKADMERPEPMDRLICGDVGYGKTEVAIRAIFKAVMDNRQVAFLTPTTILAEQHYQTLKERFANFPVSIEVLSRFRSPAQQKQIIASLKDGNIDIVIATHRLLSKDIGFKTLGLLIIDEEHRFGVAQKEKIKALKLSVDVLSLSATPIPRSLYMSLSGVRDLSIIDTPPPERYPITTYVMEYDSDIVREAIRQELERQGQVFFVHNTVHDIQQIKKHLETIYPELRIVTAHGKMGEKSLSAALMDFIDRKYDVLLATTIIESGLDMPNVNTIIIDQADRLGLAQLYQLRGRVGRSDRLAYAYITYRPDKAITEEAQERLNAIHEFNELGSGLQLALKDLEIRGSGNLLGAEQHGHINAVGFDLYTQMLEEETERIRGNTPKAQTDPLLEIPADLYIPLDYIEDSGIRMRFYRRLLFADSLAEIGEIRQELLDRFGALPEPVNNFLLLAQLKVKARSKQIKSIKKHEQALLLEFSQPLSQMPDYPTEHWCLLRPDLIRLDLAKQPLSLSAIAHFLDMI